MRRRLRRPRRHSRGSAPSPRRWIPSPRSWRSSHSPGTHTPPRPLCRGCRVLPSRTVAEVLTVWLRWVSRSVRYSEPSNLGAAIDDERRLRERRIEEHRASLEYEKLASCTFQPETNESAKPTRAAGAKDSGKGKGKGKGPKRPEARGGPVVRASLLPAQRLVQLCAPRGLCKEGCARADEVRCELCTGGAGFGTAFGAAGGRQATEADATRARAGTHHTAPPLRRLIE